MDKEYCFTSCPWREANQDNHELSNEPPSGLADRIRKISQPAIRDFAYASFAAESCPKRGVKASLEDWGGPSPRCIKEAKRIRGHS